MPLAQKAEREREREGQVAWREGEGHVAGYSDGGAAGSILVQLA